MKMIVQPRGWHLARFVRRALPLTALPFAAALQSATIAWRESAPAPEPRSGYAAGVIDGKLLLIGGAYWEGRRDNWTKKSFSASTHAFDPSSQTWEKLADAPVTLAYAAYAQVDDSIFIVGGIQDGKPCRDVYKLQMAGRRLEWRHFGQLPETRLFAAAVAANRALYLLGGTRDFEPFDSKGTCCTSATATNTLWVLETAASPGLWKPLASIPGRFRWGQRAVSDGTAIYLFGGAYQARPDDPVEKFNEVLRYDLATGGWARVASMPEAIQGAAPVFAHNKILLIGSARKAMIFDPKSATFTPIDPLPRDASVDYFGWIDPMLVGASGESPVEGPRRRSVWTFIGSLGESADHDPNWAK